jgi:hypothetical protein
MAQKARFFHLHVRVNVVEADDVCTAVPAPRNAFIYKNDPFAKPGSGQTQGKLKTSTFFLNTGQSCPNLI